MINVNKLAKIINLVFKRDNNDISPKKNYEIVDIAIGISCMDVPR